MTKKINTPDNQKIKILIAEDNAAVREFIVRAIQSDQFTITHVQDGQGALDRLNAEKYDILITDIVMPNVDGVTLALKAMRRYQDLRIIMISGYVQERMRAHNLDALVHRVIAKPFSLEEICEAVQDVLEQPPIKS